MSTLTLTLTPRFRNVCFVRALQVIPQANYTAIVPPMSRFKLISDVILLLVRRLCTLLASTSIGKKN
eukprot:1372003-Amorphochlora_amoeboformis.AAC.1